MVFLVKTTQFSNRMVFWHLVCKLYNSSALYANSMDFGTVVLENRTQFVYGVDIYELIHAIYKLRQFRNLNGGLKDILLALLI